MKRHISIIAVALMALVVVFGSCQKDPTPTPDPDPTPTYAKTQLSAKLYFSQDLIDFFDITYTVNDFAGQEISMDLTNEEAKLFETTEKNASMKTVVTITLKEEYPEIDPEKEYTFQCTDAATFGIINSDGNFDDVRTAKLTGIPSSTVMVSGEQMTPEHIQSLADVYAIGTKTVTFTVADGKTITVE